MRNLALALMFCVSTAAVAAEQSGSLTFESKERTYLLHVPEKPAEAGGRPLVVVLHFYPGTGRQMRAMTGFSQKADTEGFLAVYPDGLDSAWNALVCCGTANDVGFLRALVAHIGKSHPVDPKRIYAAGISNGGDLAYKLAAEAPDLFAAIAAVSGGLTGTARPVPSEPVSLIAFHGEKDRWFGAFEEGLGIWTDKRKCGNAMETGEGTVRRRTLTCADGSEVEHYVLKDMGHSWPGGAEGGALSAPAMPVNATDRIWEFFEKRPKP